MEDQQRRSFMAFLKLFSSLGMLNISSFSKSNVRNVTRGVSNPPDDNTPPPTYQSRLMTFFTNVSHLWNTWWEKYAPIRKLIINNKLASSFCLMICFSFISFLPLLYYGNGYNSTFLSKNPQYHVIFSDNYKTWLLVSIAVAIPMVIEAVLDYSIVCNNTVEFKNWLSRVTLVGALVIPNVILYFLVAQNSSEIEPYLPQIQFSIFFSQQIIIIGSLFGTMYEHRWDNVMNPNDRLNISIEERTVYFLLTATIAKVFICFSVLFSNAYQPLYVIAAFTSVFAVLQIIYMLIKSMRFLANQTDCNYQFNSHHHMSDFCHLMAALIFIITDFVLLITSQRLLDIDPNVTINYRYTLYITEFLYIQVALTYFLTVIPSRSYLLHAEIQKDKLNTRLNLIRYVSHEMRTPLNTAFLGLAMLLSDLKNVFKKYKERTMALKESARHSDKTGAVGGGRSDNSRGLGKPNFSKAAAPPSPSNRVESKSKDESDSELPVHPFPTQHHNNPRQDFRTLSVSNDERENHLIHPELATPQSHVTVIDDEKLQNLLFTKTEASASDIQHRQHSQSSNLQDWFFDRKFVEIFIQGLKSIVSMDTVEDMIDTVNQIHESCKVALDTLNDLLMFDKIDENKLIVEVEEIDPWILLCDTAKPFEINAKDANVSFTISCTDADSNWTFATFIKADKFKLSQVIRNLISNSLKFTPSLGTVKVKLEKLPIRQSSIKDCIDTNIAIRITVEDNGAGISLENQKKLFGQYVQFNAAQLQQGKGSGLGLWISRSIIEMHGGKINAFSAGEGKGSSFYIDLPLFTNERSQSVNFFGSADSAESALTYRTRIPVFRRGLGVNGLSTGNLKRIPSLLNKPVILMANSTRDLESAHPSIPLNSVLSAEISNPDLLRHQQTMRSIPERKGPTPPPTGTMPLHVPDLKLHKDAPLFDEVDTAPRDRDLETANSVLLEEDEEEEEEEDTGGWMDHLKRMFGTPSQSSARLVGRPSWGSSKKRRKRKTSLLVSRILPSASFLSSSSSNYSLPHFVKDKKQPNSSAVEMQQHLPSPNTPVMLDESLQHFRSIGELHQPKATPERSITVENLQSLIDSEEEDLGSLLSSPNLSSTAINMTSESYNYNQQKLRDNYYKLENIPSVDELDEDSSIVENKSIDGRKATGSSHTRDENVIIFAPLSADTRDDASLLLPVANLGTFASAPSLTSLTSVTQTQVENNVNGDGNVSGKRRKVRIEIAELGSRSSDVSPTNRSARIHMQISSKKLIHYDSKLDSLYPTRTSPTALSRNGTVKAPVKSWEGGLNILIVDDSSPNRKMLKKLLSSCNHTVYEAKDGLECLELLDYATEEGKGTRSAVGLIDVVLMDDHMPRLTGPEATSLLKSRGFPGVIYAVSGTVDQNEIDHFLSSGVEAIFAKPLNVEALKISINEYYLSNTVKV